MIFRIPRVGLRWAESKSKASYCVTLNLFQDLPRELQNLGRSRIGVRDDTLFSRVENRFLVTVEIDAHRWLPLQNTVAANARRQRHDVTVRVIFDDGKEAF